MSERNPNYMSNFMSRRSFLRKSLALGAGVGVGIFSVEPINAFRAYILETTKIQTGNAGFRESVREKCDSEKPIEQCFEELRIGPLEQANIGFVAPLTEEVAFRAVPSRIMDDNAGLSSSESTENIISGTKNFIPTRREFLVGIAQGLVFAAVHSVTLNGINTSAVPVPQFLTGLSYWFLQRRFGFMANFSAHAAYNNKMIYMQNKGMFKYR